jgi:transposase
VAWLATKTSKSAVTELMRVAWRSVGVVVARVWSDLEGRVDLLAGLRRIGIDEVSYKRGRLFLTVVVDHDTGRLVWAAAGQNKATLQRFFDALGTERCARISHVSADSAAYIANRVKANCPDAVQVADPFHVVKWANDALGEVRNEAWREARQAARQAARAHPVRRGRPRKDAPPRPDQAEQDRVKKLSRSRYALWKNPENLTEAQQVKLAWIATTDPRLYRGYQLKEGLRAILKLPLDQATEALDRWTASARRCRIPQFVALQRTITAQREPILASIEHGMSNARTESVNTKIRLRTRIAFGIKNPDALIALLMLSLGGHPPALPGRT